MANVAFQSHSLRLCHLQPPVTPPQVQLQLPPPLRPAPPIRADATHVEAAAQLAVVAHLDVDTLVEAESDQVERLFHRVHRRSLQHRNNGSTKQQQDHVH